jgi:hypothetical protein
MLKKTISVMWALLLMTVCSAQSVELEKKLLTERYQKGEFDVYKFQRYGKEWRELILKTGYPELPFTKDSSDIYFGYVTEFDRLDEKIIFSRVEEWLALHYDNLKDRIEYKDVAMGKIMLNNSIAVTPLIYRPKSNPSAVYYEAVNRFTVAGNKLRTEIFQIKIIYYYGGNSNPEYYVGPYSQSYPMTSFFPISKNESEDWLSIASILQWTKSDIEQMVKSLTDFVADYSNDYNF